MKLYLNDRTTRRRRKGARDRSSVGKNNDRKLSKSRKEKNHTSSGSTEVPIKRNPKRPTPRNIIIKM